jgi:enamine deaminase RidA (YjgF/YER057c/UK114 family)
MEASLDRLNISSGAPWESIAGYSRAVRVGQMIHVAGTTAADNKGAVVGKGDPYAQTVHILGIIEAALKEAGASLADVVRTRMYVTDMDDWEEVARAHGEVFRDIRPAATLVEVSRLIGPDFLVEIEADAVDVSQE